MYPKDPRGVRARSDDTPVLGAPPDGKRLPLEGRIAQCLDSAEKGIQIEVYDLAYHRAQLISRGGPELL
jgi:hypothetical protein